jgi:hypothetical protein
MILRYEECFSEVKNDWQVLKLAKRPFYVKAISPAPYTAARLNNHSRGMSTCFLEVIFSCSKRIDSVRLHEVSW